MATGVCDRSDITCREQVYDFPELTTIIGHLYYEFKDYKYTVYRCAAKFVKLQKLFFTSHIPYKLILAVMERHGIRDGDMNLMVPPFQLTSLIHDIFFACEKLGHFSNTQSYSLESATAVLSNFFWNIFDPHRRHSISLLEIKITFLLLCKLYASDNLVTEIYTLLYNLKTKCVPKLNFGYMLNILAKIFSYVGEGAAYGAQNIPMMMDQCYARCHNYCGLTDCQFHCLWTSTRTRFLIYANLIALIKRIEDTERIIHLNKCASCHMEKITGIRFKCETCKSLSLCLKCFATGYSSNKHDIRHRMYEVFTEDLPPKRFSDYFSKLCTGLFCKDKIEVEETKGFANETITQNDTELITITSTSRTSNASTVSLKSVVVNSSPSLASAKHARDELPIKPDTVEMEKIDASIACLTNTATNAINISEKLQLLIDKLLLQNVKLEEQLKLVKTLSSDEISKFLRNHQQFLTDIIFEMRNFSHTPAESSSLYPTSSTPNRSNLPTSAASLDNFSAVVNIQMSCENNSPTTMPCTPSQNLTHSINGADINRSYLDANKSDYSINDLSSWFNHRRLSSLPSNPLTSIPLSTLPEVSSQDELNYYGAEARDTEMQNFKLLLHKVKEIVEDSYSDNTELSEATQNLENVLDSMIRTEEGRRKSLNSA